MEARIYKSVFGKRMFCFRISAVVFVCVYLQENVEMIVALIPFQERVLNIATENEISFSFFLYFFEFCF